jgi:hypothetical protein
LTVCQCFANLDGLSKWFHEAPGGAEKGQSSSEG